MAPLYINVYIDGAKVNNNLETAKKSTKILQSSERGFGEESLLYSLFQCLWGHAER